jgi:hypothetical protein
MKNTGFLRMQGLVVRFAIAATLATAAGSDKPRVIKPAKLSRHDRTILKIALGKKLPKEPGRGKKKPRAS